VRRRVRAVALRVLLFAAIGAAATVLVAWGFCEAVVQRRLWTKYQGGTAGYWVSDGVGWGLQDVRGAGFHYAMVSRLPKLPPGAIGTLRPGAMPWVDRAPIGQPPRTWAVAAGWPKLSLAARGPVATGRQWGAERSGLTSYATDPIWPGFLVDTAFWGGAAFVVWSVPGLVRRGVRRRRGRCVGCGYELNGLAVCPECGS
jgi:hypothetical protein